MKSEVRANLIFLAILLALVLPGGIILFKKKSQPGERAIGSPDPVRTTTAWMDPYPADSVKRLAPIASLQWVSAIATREGPPEVVTVQWPTTQPAVTGLTAPQTPGMVGEAMFYGQGHSGSAAAQVMSEGRWFQVVSRSNRAPWARIVVWDDETRVEKGTFSVDGGAVPIVGTQSIPMPIAIRHDLQEAGYVMPPRQVTVLDVALPPTARELTLSFVGATRRTEKAVLP